MNPNTGEIRKLTLDQPLRPGEWPLSQAEHQLLEPMNRAQRRAWARQQRKQGRK